MFHVVYRNFSLCKVHTCIIIAQFCLMEGPRALRKNNFGLFKGRQNTTYSCWNTGSVTVLNVLPTAKKFI